jgi:paraquat-inducible protein A
MTMPEKITVCPGCDMLLENIETETGFSLICPRCSHRIRSKVDDSIDKVLALSLTGILLYLPAIMLPLITLDALGFRRSGSIIDSMRVLWDSEFYFVAIMVFLTTLFFPLLKLVLLFAVSFMLKFRIRCHCLYQLLRLYIHVDEWGMPEVYMIGVLVTIIKMYHMASIEYDIGFFCFASFMLVTMLVTICFDRHKFWEEMECLGVKAGNDRIPLEKCLDNEADPARNDMFAKGLGIAVCHDCHKLVCIKNNGDSDGDGAICSRCGASLHIRKPGSIENTWALVITAIILFFPANMLPIMKVDYLGVPQYSTIMDGIIYFFEEGSYGIGAVILTASVLVPLFKIVGIIMILLSIHFNWKSWLRHKAMMFRFIEFVGRWSMLDIFVVALLQAIVNFGFLTSIEAAPAATYFAGVVVATMMAAIAFDPRLLWDSAEYKTER